MWVQDLWNDTRQHRFAVDTVIADLLRINPKTSERKLRKKLVFNDNGSIDSWILSKCNLIALPASFGYMRVAGPLELYNNQLTALPESFGNLRVAGYLGLARNPLERLPESIGSIQVGLDLYLHSEHLIILPDSFVNIRFTRGRHLTFDGKQYKTAAAYVGSRMETVVL